MYFTFRSIFRLILIRAQYHIRFIFRSMPSFDTFVNLYCHNRVELAITGEQFAGLYDYTIYAITATKFVIPAFMRRFTPLNRLKRNVLLILQYVFPILTPPIIQPLLADKSLELRTRNQYLPVCRVAISFHGCTAATQLNSVCPSRPGSM